MKKRYEIAYLGTPEFTDKFRAAFLPYLGNQTPAVQLLQKLTSPPLSCLSAIFEYDYVDKDYQDEFAAFYAKAFKRYPPRCVRIHFFASRIARNARLNLGKFTNQYRGFLTIRPIDLHRVGPTVLQPTITDPHRQFVHCVAPFHAHILGQRFTVKGIPFVQQDTQVGACAQASLWMVARYFSAKFGLREFLPSQINQFAKSGLALGRPLPAERGLTSFQMLDALQGMGISALGYTLHDIDASSGHIDVAFGVDPLAADGSNLAQRNEQIARRQTAKLADIAYRYIESGLPVILETHNHAFVAIGHTYDPAVVAAASIQRIPAFIVHNDNTGPYLELPIFPTAGQNLSFGQVESIIAVMPHEVALRGEEAEARARTAFAELLLQVVDPGTGETIRTLLTSLRPEFAPLLDHLEYRTYLALSTELQTRLHDDIRARRFSWRLGIRMIELDYPKYIWVTEVSSSVLLNQTARDDRKCLGRVIIDSTAPAQTRGEIFVQCCDLAIFVDRNGAGDQTYGYFSQFQPIRAQVLTMPKRAIEESFPIIEINRLAAPERTAFKPIYTMHKWFARRASCVFRGILLGALKPAGTDIMAEFYRDHGNDPDTQGKVIFDPFMGGGTTVVEALRLGCKVVGVDLNPVAWFVVKTQVEPIDLPSLDAAFDRLANRSVAWSGKRLRETLLNLYRTEAPWTLPQDGAPALGQSDSIYTFWVKSAPCTSPTCRQPVPLFGDYVIAAKSPAVRYHPDCTCPRCHKQFDWEIEPAVLVADPRLMVHAAAYSGGAGRATARWTYAHPDGGIFVSQGAPTEGQANVRSGHVPAGHVSCPHCAEVIKPQIGKGAASAGGKGHKPRRKKVPLTVLLCPHTEEVFQWRGDLAEDTRVRSPTTGHEFSPYTGNLPEKGRFVCPHCGNNEAVIEAIRSLPADERLPLSAYAILAYAPGCDPRFLAEDDDANPLDLDLAETPEASVASDAADDIDEDESAGVEFARPTATMARSHNLIWLQKGKYYCRHSPADLTRFQ